MYWSYFQVVFLTQFFKYLVLLAIPNSSRFSNFSQQWRETEAATLVWMVEVDIGLH